MAWKAPGIEAEYDDHTTTATTLVSVEPGARQVP
jgi:hypothetical protein